MPRGAVEETSAGLPFKAAWSVGAKLSWKSLHVNLSLFQSRGLGGKGECVYEGGFRLLVLGNPGIHVHVCGESLRSFC